MAWCFSTRASVATVLTTHPCVSRCLRVNTCIANPIVEQRLVFISYPHWKFLVRFIIESEGCLHIKMLSYQNRITHYNDNTVWRLSHFIMEIPILGRQHIYIEIGPRPLNAWWGEPAESASEVCSCHWKWCMYRARQHWHIMPQNQGHCQCRLPHFHHH